MGIAVDGDDIVPSLQQIAALSAHVVGGQIFQLEGDGHGFGGAGLQHSGLVKDDQVGAGLFNAAVGVGGIEIDLHHVLSGHAAGVGDSDFESNGAIAFGDGSHLLFEAGVAQAVTEGVLDHVVVVNQALLGGGFIELIAYIDAFHIVDKGGRGTGRVKAAGVAVHIAHVGVFEVAEVVPLPPSGSPVRWPQQSWPR